MAEEAFAIKHYIQNDSLSLSGEGADMALIIIYILLKMRVEILRRAKCTLIKMQKASTLQRILLPQQWKLHHVQRFDE